MLLSNMPYNDIEVHKTRVYNVAKTQTGLITDKWLHGGSYEGWESDIEYQWVHIRWENGKTSDNTLIFLDSLEVVE